MLTLLNELICSSTDVKCPLTRERISCKKYLLYAEGETAERNSSNFRDMLELITATKPAGEKIKTVTVATSSQVCKLRLKGPQK